MVIIEFKGEEKYESYEGANPWGCTHTHTQALLSVEEKKQKSKINKLNRDSGKSIKVLCLFLLSFYVVKNYKKDGSVDLLWVKGNK